MHFFLFCKGEDFYYTFPDPNSLGLIYFLDQSEEGSQIPLVNICFPGLPNSEKTIKKFESIESSKKTTIKRNINIDRFLIYIIVSASIKL